MGLLLVLFSKTKRKAQHSSKSLKKICIERIVNSAIPKNIQKVTRFGISVFNGVYTDFSMLCSKIRSQLKTRFCSKLTLTMTNVYKLALNT